MARVSPYELGNVAAFVYEAAKGLTGRVVESTAEVSQPRPAAGQWSRRGGMTQARNGWHTQLGDPEQRAVATWLMLIRLPPLSSRVVCRGSGPGALARTRGPIHGARSASRSMDGPRRSQPDKHEVAIKAKDLERQFCDVMPGATAMVEFLGAAQLWKRANAVPSYTSQLSYQENATSGTGHVALVKLRDYMTFLTDENGRLRRHIFDLNVRDYQGDVEVNREMRDSLDNAVGPEFWWLNNGVTIICSKASSVSKTYILDDVQIVNGLQTSHTVHRVLRDAPDDHPAFERSVLVRILVTGDDPVTRDRVIRATNRQTSVPAASLRATDDIQRNIESYFSAHDWFYDRRKNFYRNSGKSPERIVSIPLLAQAVMAMGLSRPDNSRARPSSLLKRDEDYDKIFSASVALPIYLWLAMSQKGVDAFLLSEDAGATTQERTNLRFHLAMVAAAKLLGDRVHAPVQLDQLATTDRSITEADLALCLGELRESFSLYADKSGDAADKIAKGSDFIEFLLTRVLPVTPGTVEAE